MKRKRARHFKRKKAAAPWGCWLDDIVWKAPQGWRLTYGLGKIRTYYGVERKK